MKVLHVVGGYPTPEHPHHQVFIATQVASLAASGVDCDVLVLQGRGPRKYVLGRPQLRRRLAADGFDLIHAHYAYCGFVALGAGLPLVTSFLGSDLYGFPRRDGTFPVLMRVFHNRLARFVARRSAAAIVKSERMKADLGLEVHVVPNGVDCDLFHPVTAQRRLELRRELGLDPGTRYVLFAGNPELPRKRFALARAAVEAAAAASAVPLSLLPLSGRPHADVVRHMQACDLLILTSSLEGSPNVVKEAMSAGMAIVSVDVGDARERLGGVSGCRVAPDERPETIGALVAELLASEEPRDGPRAVAPLRMEAVAARIVAIYEDVLSRREGSRTPR